METYFISIFPDRDVLMVIIDVKKYNTITNHVIITLHGSGKNIIADVAIIIDWL